MDQFDIERLMLLFFTYLHGLMLSWLGLSLICNLIYKYVTPNNILRAFDYLRYSTVIFTLIWDCPKIPVSVNEEIFQGLEKKDQHISEMNNRTINDWVVYRKDSTCDEVKTHLLRNIKGATGLSIEDLAKAGKVLKLKAVLRNGMEKPLCSQWLDYKNKLWSYPFFWHIQEIVLCHYSDDGFQMMDGKAAGKAEVKAKVR